jgi:hypothetical protein
MKRIIYFFLLIVLSSALYSCSEQYDNIEQYATEESVYAGRYDPIPDNAIKVGYKRVEIDLMSSVGRISADDIYLGKAKKTVVEFEEPDGPRKRVFEPACSWVNIIDLPTQKTYVFSIYTEDGDGNKSIAETARARPFTDVDLAGISFPLPYTIPSPTTIEFRWTEDSGLSTSLFVFAELSYSYTDRDGEVKTGKLTSTESPRFSITNLIPSDNIPISVTCKIIPIMDNVPILDTVTMVREFYAKTASPDEYLAARELRLIKAANISPDNLTEATIEWEAVTDHLVWAEVRYEQIDGTFNVIRVENDEDKAFCTNVKRGGKIQTRSAFNPPQTSDEFISEWKDYAGSFLLKYDRRDWVVLPSATAGYYNGWNSAGNWVGGFPMQILDDDINTGWHSTSGSPPKMLIVDMKKTNRITNIVLENNYAEQNYGYWNHINIYLINEPPVSGYSTHTVNWADGQTTRVDAYRAWLDAMIPLVPSSPPTSWGTPVAQIQAPREHLLSIVFPQATEGQYLIIAFMDSTGGDYGWLHLMNLDAYDE